MVDTVYFAAIDASITSTGISILSVTDENKFILHDKTTLSVGTKKYNDPTKFNKKMDMYRLFKFYFDNLKYKVSFAVFENYSYRSNGQLADIGELGGLYKSYLHQNDISFDTIPPASVKLIVTGNGRAEKTEVAEAIRKHVINIDNFTFNNYDETDSVAVGIAYSLKMLEIIEDEPKQNTVKNKRVRRVKPK